MELVYFIAGLVIALAFSFWLNSPKKICSVVIIALIEVFRENEAQIVQKIYNSLPSSLKKQTDSVTVAKLVDHFLNVITEMMQYISDNKKD